MSRGYHKSGKDHWNFRHGFSLFRDVHPLYSTWLRMKARCENPKHPKFPIYGGRGIKVCKRWHRFENFLSDMGMPPGPGLQLDRKDNDGDYKPGNCRWATLKEQARNKRNNHILEFNGIRACFSEWAERTGIKRGTIKSRILNYGWTVERALTTP